MGNYHLASNASPAVNLGAASKAAPSYQQPPASIAAPAIDIDDGARPFSGGFDAGADELGSVGTGGGGGGGGGAPALPTLAVLDSFNRANSNNLGGNWSQASIAGIAAIRVNANQASDLLITGQAFWNAAGSTFGAKQGAAFTFANAPVSGTTLILKATGGTANAPQSFIRVRYTAGSVRVEVTTNSGGSYQSLGQFTATPASGNTLLAVANADGTVDVWLNSDLPGPLHRVQPGCRADRHAAPGGSAGRQLQRWDRALTRARTGWGRALHPVPLAEPFSSRDLRSPKESVMSGKSPRRLFDRRSFLKGAGAALVASAGVGLVPGFLRKTLLPEGFATAAAADSPPDLFFAGTDGWISLPRRPADRVLPPGQPRPGPVHHLHLRVPQRHRPHRRPAGHAEEPRPALGAAVLGGSVRPGRAEGLPDAASPTWAWPCAPTCSTPTPSTGTGSATSSRSSTASRPGRSRCPPGASSPTSTGRATPGRTCSTATSRTWSTSTWG